MSTQLTELETFNPANIVFEAFTKRSFKDKDGKTVETKSMDLSIKYPNGSKGPLIFQLPRCDTRGFSAQFGDGLDKTFALYLGENDTITTEHKQVINAINQVVAACTKYCLTDDFKAKLGKWDLEESDFKKKFNPIEYQKDKDTKKPKLDQPQVMYLKVMTKVNKETQMKESISRFYNEGEFDERGNPIEVHPLEFIGKSGTCVPLIKVDKIFFGVNYKLQVKIYQCDVRVNDTGFKSLIKRAPTTVIRTSGSATANNNLASYLDDDDVDMEDDVPATAASAPVAEEDDDANEADEVNEADEDVEEVQSSPKRARSPSPPPATAKVAKTSSTARRTGKK